MAKKELSTKEKLTKKIREINPALDTWEIWEALMSVFSCSIANAVETDKKIYDKREKEFKRAMSKLNNAEAIAETFILLNMAIMENPCTDILGELYMSLKLGNHWKGQFFTPQNVAEMMAKICMGKEAALEAVKENDCVSVEDPCCGSGVMLLAGAKNLAEYDVNYQRKALFVGQDIDRIVVQMCYIQLALNECIGYVCVADSLKNPIIYDENGVLQAQPGQEFWFTPRYTLCKLQNEASEKSA